MPYYLADDLIRSPSSLSEENNTQFAQNRTLDGGVTRDYFGNIKRVWTLNYDTVNKNDYFTIRAIYNNYLTAKNAINFEITEDNYTILQTQVFMDIPTRDFSVKGTDYLSNFTVTLTEA
jgi:hypothetical protein